MPEEDNPTTKEPEKAPPETPATPHQEPARVAPRKLKSIAKIPKLSGILETAGKDPSPEKTESRDDDKAHAYGTAPFTEDRLNEVWEEFADSVKNAGRNSEYAVLKQQKRLADNHRIIITFTNSVKEVILDKFRPDLIAHLKSRLNNRYITLETELKEEESQKIPYTPAEKFEALAREKPVLYDLKNRLGLDTDF